MCKIGLKKILYSKIFNTNVEFNDRIQLKKYLKTQLYCGMYDKLPIYDFPKPPYFLRDDEIPLSFNPNLLIPFVNLHKLINYITNGHYFKGYHYNNISDILSQWIKHKGYIQIKIKSKIMDIERFNKEDLPIIIPIVIDYIIKYADELL